MKKLFVPYNIALLAKEKGFNEDCLAYYGNEERLFITAGAILKYRPLVKVPLYQQMIDWFREKHNILIVLEDSYNTETKVCKYYPTLRTYNNPDYNQYSKESYTRYFGDCWTENYYEALDIAILKAFKLI